MRYLWRRIVALTFGLGLTGLGLAADTTAAPPPPRWGQAAPPPAFTPQSPYAQQNPVWQPVAHAQPFGRPVAVTLDRPVPLADNVPLPTPLPNYPTVTDAALQPARFTPTIDPNTGRPPLLRQEPTGGLSPDMFKWKPTAATSDTKQPEGKVPETTPMPKPETLANPQTTVPGPSSVVQGMPLPLPLPGPSPLPGPYPNLGPSPAPVFGAPPPPPLISTPAPVISTPMPAHPVSAAPLPGPQVPCPPGGPCPPVPCPPVPCPPGGCPVPAMGMMPVACGSCGAAGAAPNFVDGADPCYTPWSTFYVSSEYLMWWTKGSDIPPLVSTGPLASAIPGAIGQPGTVILHGGESVLDGMRWGMRTSAGLWFDESRCFGIDGNFFFLGKETERFSVTSSGVPELSRPLIINGVERRQVTASSLAAFLSAGSVNIEHNTQLWGGEANFRTNLACTPSCFIDLLVGWRTLNLEDETRIVEFVNSMQPNRPGSFLLTDEFKAQNTFHGGQLGLVGEHRLAQRWTLGWAAKIAMGTTNQRVDINGSTVISGAGADNGTYVGGVLALQPNIGSHSRNVFSVVPEVQVNLGYQLNPHIRTFVGYNFMYWSNVARAGEHINRNINPNFLQPQVPPITGPNEPSFNWNSGGYWAQGLNLGLQFSW